MISLALYYSKTLVYVDKLRKLFRTELPSVSVLVFLQHEVLNDIYQCMFM